MTSLVLVPVFEIAVARAKKARSRVERHFFARAVNLQALRALARPAALLLAPKQYTISPSTGFPSFSRCPCRPNPLSSPPRADQSARRIFTSFVAVARRQNPSQLLASYAPSAPSSASTSRSISVSALRARGVAFFLVGIRRRIRLVRHALSRARAGVSRVRGVSRGVFRQGPWGESAVRDSR